MELFLAFDVFLGGLASPDGLAMASDGTVFVAEEAAGVVRGISPDGTVFTAMAGLESPEGIAWHPELGLLAVEDVPQGRLVSSVRGVLRDGIHYPEGVAVCPDGEVYYTWALVGGPTGINRWTPDGCVPIVTLPRGFMLSGIAVGPDGVLYACNEMPVTGLLVSVIAACPDGGAWLPYAGGIPSAEGLRFSPDGGTLMVASEENGSVIAVTPSGETSVFASGFGSVEDMIFLPEGDMLVTDDEAGCIYRVPFP